MRINISLADAFINRLRSEAAKSGMGVSEYIRYCVTRYWDAKEEAEKILKRGE